MEIMDNELTRIFDKLDALSTGQATLVANQLTIGLKVDQLTVDMRELSRDGCAKAEGHEVLRHDHEERLRDLEAMTTDLRETTRRDLAVGSGGGFAIGAVISWIIETIKAHFA